MSDVALGAWPLVHGRLFHLEYIKEIGKQELICQNAQTLLREQGLIPCKSSCTLLGTVMELGAQISNALMGKSAAIAVLYRSPDTGGPFPPNTVMYLFNGPHTVTR